MEFVELQKVYRQHDEKFIDLLNSVRNNTITEKVWHFSSKGTIRNLNRRPVIFMYI